jgi:hypothetical protein
MSTLDHLTQIRAAYPGFLTAFVGPCVDRLAIICDRTERQHFCARRDLRELCRAGVDWFQCGFDLGEQLRSRSDSIELESFGFD